MGLLKHLLFWPVTGPLALARFSLGQVEKAAHRELTDEERVKEELMELQLLLELGDVDEEEYVEREAGLMERLREVRRWRERLGMGTAWGPLTLPPPGDEDSPA
jgi:hypothetical protein